VAGFLAINNAGYGSEIRGYQAELAWLKALSAGR
jgi:hypothetical protein